jgi:hypothetical protein
MRRESAGTVEVVAQLDAVERCATEKRACRVARIAQNHLVDRLAGRTGAPHGLLEHDLRHWAPLARARIDVAGKIRRRHAKDVQKLVQQRDAETERVDARRRDVDLAHHGPTVAADETTHRPRNLGRPKSRPRREKDDQIARGVSATLELERNRHTAIRTTDATGREKTGDTTHTENVLIKTFDIGELGVDNGALGARHQVDRTARVRRASNRLDLSCCRALIRMIVQISRINRNSHWLQRLSLQLARRVARQQLTARCGTFNGAFVATSMQNAAFAIVALHLVPCAAVHGDRWLVVVVRRRPYDEQCDDNDKNTFFCNELVFKMKRRKLQNIHHR